MGLREVIKNMVMKALNIVPAQDNTLSIKGAIISCRDCT